MRDFGYRESCLQYEGERLYFDPHGGWGWFRVEDGESLPPENNERGVCDPFYFRVHQFYRHGDIWSGAMGIVEQAGHKYDGMWFVFHAYAGWDDSNLIENLPTVCVLLGPDEPTRGQWNEPEKDKLWPRWHFVQSPQIGGYGMVAVSPAAIEKDERKIRPS